MKRFLSILFVISLCLAACGAPPDDGVTPALPDPEHADMPEDMPPAYAPAYSGELILSMRPPKTLNPILNTDATVDRTLHLLFEPLFNIDENFRLWPNIAETFEPQADGVSAVITLRRDVFWSDGTQLTSDDFVFTVNELKAAPEGAVYKSNVNNIISYEPYGDFAAIITFSGSLTGVMYQFTFPLIPAHYYRNNREPDSYRNMNPVGNGAYRFVSYKNGGDMLLSASSYGQAPYIQGVKVIITPDAETDAYAFNQHIVDILATNYADWNKYRTGKTEANICEYNTTMYEFLGFNFDNYYLQNKALRQAIAMSCDKSDIATGAYLGAAVASDVPVHPSSWLLDAEVTVYPYSLALAEATLLENGFLLDSGKLYARNESGETERLSFSLLVNEENACRVAAAESIKKNLAGLGIEIMIETANFDDYRECLRAHNFDMFIGGFNLPVFPDVSFAFHSSQIFSGSNYFSYNDPILDALLMDVYAADNTTLTTAVSAVQKRIGDETPVVSLCYRKSILLTSTRVQGDIKPAVNNVFANVRKWFIITDT